MPGLGLVRLSRRSRIAAALLVAGIALIAAAFVVDRGERLTPAGDHAVNVGAGNLGDISAHNSPTVVRNPRDRDELIVTSRIDSPDFSCAVHSSSDGGRSWSRTRVPIPRGPGRKCYAPDAAFGPDGTLYVSYVTLQGRGNTPAAAWVARSHDGGRTLSSPRRVTGPLAFQVRIAVDPDRPGRVYVSWVQARAVGQLRFAGAGNPIQITRSDDGGRTWRRPVRVNSPVRQRVLAPSAAVGAHGTLFVLYLDVGTDRLDYDGGHDAFGGPPYGGRFELVLARSLDGGATWQESVVDRHVVPTTRFIAFLPPFPSLAIDRQRGFVYVAYQDGRLGSADVWLWTLKPGAPAWAGPVRVNDTPARDGSSQYLPRADVAPDGRLDVVYYDRRADGQRNALNAVSLQSSRDHGRSFGSHIELSSVYFDARIGFGSERGLPDLGSRLALISDNRGALAVWSDTRSGTEASSKQDLYSAVARADGPGARRAFMLVGGLVLLAAAALSGLRRRGT